jgi:hypothetical protein
MGKGGGAGWREAAPPPPRLGCRMQAWGTWRRAAAVANRLQDTILPHIAAGGLTIRRRLTICPTLETYR